jgi:hypothetical protein
VQQILVDWSALEQEMNAQNNGTNTDRAAGSMQHAANAICAGFEQENRQEGNTCKTPKGLLAACKSGTSHMHPFVVFLRKILQVRVKTALLWLEQPLIVKFRTDPTAREDASAALESFTDTQGSLVTANTSIAVHSRKLDRVRPQTTLAELQKLLAAPVLLEVDTGVLGEILLRQQVNELDNWIRDAAECMLDSRSVSGDKHKSSPLVAAWSGHSNTGGVLGIQSKCGGKSSNAVMGENASNSRAGCSSLRQYVHAVHHLKTRADSLTVIVPQMHQFDLFRQLMQWLVKAENAYFCRGLSTPRTKGEGRVSKVLKLHQASDLLDEGVSVINATRNKGRVEEHLHKESFRVSIAISNHVIYVCDKLKEEVQRSNQWLNRSRHALELDKDSNALQMLQAEYVVTQYFSLLMI